MKRSPIKNLSERGKFIRYLDGLLSIVLRHERGYMCEVHNRPCSGLGASHILNKRRYPRLRFYEGNILIAGWFCSHFYSHMDSDDPRTIEYRKAVEKKLGKDWKEKLLIQDKISPIHNFSYLNMLKFVYETKKRSLGI